MKGTRNCCHEDIILDWGSGLSNGLGNDWTMLDPAIVSGQLANNLEPPPHLGNNLGRPESPPNWITANLEQLTEGGAVGPGNFSSQNNLIPAFNGLGLGGERHQGAPVGRPGPGRLGGAGWGPTPSRCVSAAGRSPGISAV